MNMQRHPWVPIFFLSFFVSGLAFAQGNGGGNSGDDDPEVITMGAPGGPGGGGEDPPGEVHTEKEVIDRLRVGESLTPYGIDLMGERVDLATGSLTFQHVDVSLPGNSGLPVEIRRSLRTSQGFRARHFKAFGDWSLDIPSLSMKVSREDGWQDNRCNGPSEPEDVIVQGKLYMPWDFWNGLKLSIPGQGTQTVLDYPNGPIPGPAHVTGIRKTTTDYWKITCLTSIQNGSGEGFVAESPDGIKYTLDVMVYQEAGATKGLLRYDAYMLASKVEDRYGNKVEYVYTGSTPLTTKLDYIIGDAGSTDERKIDVTYTGDNITSVTVNGRTWNYAYTGDYLTTVQWPPHETGATRLQWTYGLASLVSATLKPGAKLICGGANPDATGSITHPYGAQATYKLRETAHGRSQVPYNYVNGGGSGTGSSCIGEDVRHQRSFDTYSLVEKTLSGPGLDSMTWDFSYSETQGGWTTSTGVSDINTTTVIDPEGHKTVHSFDRTYTWKEHAAVKTEHFNGTTTLLRTVDQDYVVGPYMGTAGALLDNEAPMEKPRSMSQRVITENGDTYTSDYTFDYSSTDYDYDTTHPCYATRTCYSYGKAIEVDEYNSVNNHSKTTENYYIANQTDWMLGVFMKNKVGSETPVEIGYTNYLPTTFKQWGVTVATRNYNADGTINWEKDANNHQHAFSNHYRGSPRTITYPDTLTRQYTLDYFGNTESTTDRAGHVTAFDFDDLDRLIEIDYPDDPTLVRLNKDLVYEQVSAAEYNDPDYALDQYQWKQTKTRGEHKVTTYLDALLRPVLAKTEDTTDASLTRFVRKSYDSQRAVFESFPADDAVAADGTNITIDGLGRVTQSAENVSPYADTDYEYLAGNKVRGTNPRDKQTTTTYFALGAPDQSLPTLIQQPESVTTTIVRNNFGEMTSATQSGTNPTVSATRSYFYDSSHRLCRQVDPETGSTAYSHNDAEQLEWYALAASGSSTSCDLASVPANEKIVHTYNNLGQLTDVDYPDSSPDLTYGFDNNGNLTSLTSSDASWSYTHNAVNSLVSETLVTGGQTFSLSYRFDTMDRLDQITYPGSTVVSITPNAYGEPESVGSYATSIDYWPNGSIKEVDYGTQQGSGRKYTTSQNARQLPENLKVVLGAATLADLTHSYDPNANVTSITDAVNGTGFDRSMGYDDIDRLTSASGFWGSGSYSFDALGNILTKTESGIDLDYTYNSSTNLLTSVDDTVGSADYTFSYDDYGNVTNNGNQGFTYNLAGNLASSTSPSFSYKYDGHKRRVQKDDGSQISYTVYGQNGKLMHKLKGGVSTHYIYAGSLLIAELQGSTVNYLHTDLLGSPIKGDNGTAYAEHYRPWGEKKDYPVQLADDVGYTGHQNDVATSLTYMQARYYDPVVGRFMAVDPVQFGGDNPMSFGRYTYANDNPFRFVDPNGQQSAPPIDFSSINIRTQLFPSAVAQPLEGAANSIQEAVSEAMPTQQETAAMFDAVSNVTGAAAPAVALLGVPQARAVSIGLETIAFGTGLVADLLDPSENRTAENIASGVMSETLSEMADNHKVGAAAEIAYEGLKESLEAIERDKDPQ